MEKVEMIEAFRWNVNESGKGNATGMPWQM